MLPLILGVVGGYLIGDSIKDKAIFEEGGVLDRYDDSIIRKVVLQALSENDGSGYRLRHEDFSKHYIHSLISTVKYNEDFIYSVVFSYELYKDKYDGYYDYSVTVEGEEVDRDLFTKEENDLIEYELEGLREYLLDGLSD